MNCRKVFHSLSAYIDGELSGVEHRQIRAHLEQCGECRAEYENLRQVRRLLNSMSVHRPAPELANQLLHRLSQDTAQERLRASFSPVRWGGGRRTIGRRKPMILRLAAGGAVLALLAVLNVSRLNASRLDEPRMPTQTLQPVAWAELPQKTSSPPMSPHCEFSYGVRRPSLDPPMKQSPFSRPPGC